MPGRPVITARLCVGLSPCIACCIARSLVHTLKSGLTADSVAYGAEVSYGHFGTSAKLLVLNSF